MPPLGTQPPWQPTPPEEPEPAPEPETAETVAVRKHRYDEACAAGFTDAEASLFADSDQDVGLLRKLIKGGCPLDKMRDILL